MANYQKPEDIVGENGLLKQLTRALMERVLGAELTTLLREARSGRLQKR